MQLAEQRMARKGCSAEENNVVAGLFFTQAMDVHRDVQIKINRDANKTYKAWELALCGVG